MAASRESRVRRALQQTRAVEGTLPGYSGLYYDPSGRKQRWAVDDYDNWTLEQVPVASIIRCWQLPDQG